MLLLPQQPLFTHHQDTILLQFPLYHRSYNGSIDFTVFSARGSQLEPQNGESVQEKLDGIAGRWQTNYECIVDMLQDKAA